MRGEIVQPEMPHEEARGEEQARLEHHGQSNRQAQDVDLLQLREVGLKEIDEYPVEMELRRQPHHCQHQQETAGEGAGARDARTHQTESGQSEMPEDQRVVEQRVEQHREAHHDQRGPRPRQRGRIVAQNLKGQRKRQTEGQRHYELRRRMCQLLGLAEQQQNRMRELQEHHQRHAYHQHRPEAHARDGAHVAARLRVGAQDVRYHRRHRRGRARAEQPAEIEHGVAQHRTGHRLLGKARQHQCVGRADRHLKQLRRNQRQRELQQLAALGDPRVQPVPRDADPGIGNIEFGYVGHDTDLSF